MVSPVRRLLFLGAATLLIVSCEKSASPQVPKVQEQEIFTTSISLSLFGDPSDQVYNRIFDRLHQIDRLMSDYDKNSELSRVSALAGTGPVRVSPETLMVVKTGLSESALTSGIFDPTIGPVTHLWDVSGNMGKPTTRVPTTPEIASALALVNWKNVAVDGAAGTIELKKKGMVLDLGGVAKGYAMDEALRIAKESGVTSGIFNMGNSSMALLGKKPGNIDWKIGIQDPFQAPGSFFAVVSGSDMTVETSGTYQKFFMYEGRRYHHIMDPRTGSPADSGLEQVTLILPLDTKLADGLSTSCFILGIKQGMALIESLPDAAAIFVASDKKVYLSSRVGKRFDLKDVSFKVVPKT